MKTITISTISKDRNNVTIKLDISPELKRYFNETTFFTEYTFDITNIPNSVLVVPVLTNLLPFSWITDTVIWVNEIDQDFYNCLQVLKTGFRELHPNTQIKGTIIAAQIINNCPQKENKTLQFFTGGIDATATLLRIRKSNPILVNTNGWYNHSPKEQN